LYIKFKQILYHAEDVLKNKTMKRDGCNTRENDLMKKFRSSDLQACGKLTYRGV